jgi:hypothetical protein
MIDERPSAKPISNNDKIGIGMQDTPYKAPVKTYLKTLKLKMATP